MSFLNQYNIEFRSLKEGVEHDFNFVVEDEFFNNIPEESLINGGKIDAEVKILKRQNELFINLKISGKLKITCGRCLEDYFENVKFDDFIVVKFDEYTNFDTNNSFITLNKNEDSINIDQFIYEFCEFSLPLSCVHPKDDEGNDTCNKKMIDIIDDYKAEDEKIDPRWEKLKEFLN